MSLKTTALFPPQKNEQHKLRQANVVALFCFFFQRLSFHAELELHQLVMLAMLHGVTLAVALVSTEGLHASLAAFQEVYEAGKNGWSCMSVIRDAGMDAPQKNEWIYIYIYRYSESANINSGEHFEVGVQVGYIFLNIQSFSVHRFLLLLFFPLVETSLIVGPMELKIFDHKKSHGKVGGGVSYNQIFQQ